MLEFLRTAAGRSAGLLLALTLLSGTRDAAAAESADGLWRVIDENAVARASQPRRIVPQRYLTVQLDRAALQPALSAAPMEDSAPPARSATIISLPRPDGSFERFSVVESPIMAPALAAKYPEIRTYLGQGLDDPSATLRFDISPQGFRAQVIGWRGTYYIDPYQPKDLDTYVVYRKVDAMDDGERPRCGVTGQELPKDLPNFQQKTATPKISSGTVRRSYRLAVAATGEYTAFQGGTVADGLAAIVTTLNRVNGVYERELSVRMLLIANNDQIIYTNGATDPYTNGNGSAMLGQNQSTLTAVIGGANYDIGHVVSTGGGGVAILGSVCSDLQKARGVTGSGSPVGDPFDVDFVAHEIGHQFRGNHTFNGSGGNCSGGNRNNATAYEVGSGISIQAYAGICAADNLQPNSEDYFQRISLDEMLVFTTTGGGSSCGSTNATGNTPPTVSTTATYTIPRQTPFELSAVGSDADGDTVTYLWEQFDRGTSANAAGVLVDAGQGPLFRSFAPTLEPTRVFPSLRWILGSANVAPATAPLPGTASPSFFAAELLPSTARTLNFRVTARDNRAGGGGTNEANTALTVSTAAGPFLVTLPNTAVSWAAGSSQTLSWDVANTAAAPVSAATVRLRLSLDGGFSWPIELGASTANDGSETVTIPANTPATTQARVRVEAIGNVFFDVSNTNFTITGGNTPPSLTVSGSVSTRQGSPTATAVVASVSDTQDAAGSLSVSVSGAPPELAVTASNSGGSVSLSASAECSLVAPGGNRVYPVRLAVTDSAGASTRADVNISVSRNLTPTLGTYANQTLARGAAVIVVPSAPASDANGNLVARSISPTTLPGGGSVSITDDGSVSISVGAGATFGSYPLRVEITDSCGAAEWRQFDVVVASNEAALSLLGTVLATGNGLLEPNECNQFNVSLRNDGTVAATGITATLSTSSPNVSISQASAGFADIAGNGGTGTSQVPFEISSSAGLVCFTDVELQLAVSYSGGPSPYSTSVSLPVGQPASPNYAFVASSGATLPSGGSLVAGSQADDAVVSVAVPAGFSFSLYDTVINGGATLRASTNGNLQLAASGGSADWDNTGLPATGTSNNQGSFPTTAPVLMPFWDDLTPTAAGSPGAGIYTHLLGTAPNRSWLVEWRGRRFDDPNGTRTVNFAIEFREGQSEFSYLYVLTGAGVSNGNSASVGVQAATTGTRFTQYSLNQAAITPGLRLDANFPAALCTSGSGGCGAQPGVVLIQSGGGTAVTEGGAGDSYTVALDSVPSGTVSFTATADAQVSVTPASLSFNPMNYNLPQTITVSAVDDSVVEGAHAGLITHAVSGGGYSGVSVAPVNVAIVDNDTATVTTAAAVVPEGDSGSAPMSFLLQLQGQVAGGFSVNYSTRSDTAVAGQDFTAASGSVVFDASQNPSRTVTVQISGDALPEADERLFLDLTSSTPGIVFAPASVDGLIVNDDLIADLRVSLLRQPGLVTAGATVTYTLRVENLSSVLAVADAGVRLSPAALLTAVSWACTAAPGSSCPAASGSGAIDEDISLGSGGLVEFTITATVPPATANGTSFGSSASVTPPAGYSDPNSANNAAVVNSRVGIDGVFADGFEAQ